jgi:hypothetical protein
MATRPTLKPFAFIVILLLLGALAAGNYFVLRQAPFGPCAFGTVPTEGDVLGYDAVQSSCLNYVYYFAGAPLVVALLLMLILPSLVTPGATLQEVRTIEQPSLTPADTKKPAVLLAPSKPTSDAAVQLLALLQREGRLIDFLREDIQPYDDTQVGAAVRTIHQACRQVLAEHLTLEPVLSGQEGDEVIVPKDFDPSAIRLTGNVSGEPPFRGALRHAGWRAVQVKLPGQPSGQDPKIVAPAEVEIP